MNRRLIHHLLVALLFSLSTVGSSFNDVQDERIGRPVQDERNECPRPDAYRRVRRTVFWQVALHRTNWYALPL